MKAPASTPASEVLKDPSLRWSLVLPLKPLAVAKSRLAPSASASRPALALAFAQDTVAAALACPTVCDITVVTDDPVAASALSGMGAHTLPDSPAAGLNAAMAYGVRRVRERRPNAPVAALGADLPALRPTELGRVLAEAAVTSRRTFLADAARVGTTLLAAPGEASLDPAFGGPSRARHWASGALEITGSGVDSVRQDVDTAEDFAAALALGLGPYTLAVLRKVPHLLRPGRPASAPTEERHSAAG